jgi:hypothetical protein
MQELANEYKKSLKLLNKRINELILQKSILQSINDPQLDELKERLKILLSMQRDTKEVIEVILHYHERGYWRDERYTCNARKSRKFIYVEPIYDEACDEL